jgi:putative tricarboxylic transport membrane protein
MATTRRDAWSDLALAACSVIGAGLLFVGTADLPASRYEPLGSATLPRALAVFMVLFAVIIAVRAALALRRATEAGTAELQLPGRLVLVVAATAAYVFALDQYTTPYIPTTVVFTVAMGAILANRRPKTLVAFAVLGVVLAVAIRFVMTRFLFVDLG